MLKSYKLLAFLVAIIVGIAAKGGVQNFLSGGADPMQETLMQTANQLNKTLPIMIDKDTELVSTIGVNKRFVYNYRLVNHSADQLNAQQLQTVMKPEITNAACTTPQTRDELLKKGVTLQYSYVDKNRTHILSIDVAPSDCKL